MPRNAAFRHAALAGSVALLLTGCDSLFGTESRFAERARVSVAGDASVPLLLITSVNFFATQDFLTGEQETTLVAADTSHITALPFERTVPLGGRDRFLVRLVNPDTAETVTVHLQVELDGRLVFTQWASMRDASLEYTTSFQPR